MSGKVYTLELTAEELLSTQHDVGKTLTSDMLAVLREKFRALAEQARADKERDELRLPWRAEDLYNGAAVVKYGNGFVSTDIYGRKAANLMSAAPELLEAVQAVKWWDQGDADPGWPSVMQLIERALRKVETGIPEEP